MASTAVTCPAQSNGAGRRGDGAVRASRTRAAAPAGTLMKKISRQLARVSSPPVTGPAEDAIAPPIAHMATARARRAGSGNAWPIRAIDDGIMTAAAAPCTSRAVTSTPRPGARPQAAEASTNPATPAPNARRAPIRSASAPADSSSAANISVYPAATHCRPLIPPPKSARTDGSATLTTVASSVTTKNPSTAAASVKPGRETSRTPGLTRRPLATICVDIRTFFPCGAWPRLPGAQPARHRGDTSRQPPAGGVREMLL